MKKFTKLFLSCAAVAAVTAAVATTAMAAATVDATYGENDGKLTLATTGVSGTATVLVLDEQISAETADENILYVDQTADGKFGTDGVVGLLDLDTTDAQYLADGVYYVYVGYYEGDTFAIATDTFSIGNVGKDIVVGDANGDGEVKAVDSTFLARYLADLTTGIGNVGTEYVDATDSSKKVVVGDANGDAEVKAVDSTFLARYLADLTTGIGNVGKTVTVVEAN